MIEREESFPALPALPARPGSLTGSPGTRLRKVRTLGGILPSLGVRVIPSDNGTVNVQLPAEVAELFILDLEQRAQEWKEAMGKARLQEMQRAAELQAESGEARRKWEAQTEEWALEYQRLRAKGKGHREALHAIRGPNNGDAETVTAVEMAVQAGAARLRRRQREARDAEILRLAGDRFPRQAIADALRISYHTVRVVLKKANAPTKDARRQRRGTVGAPR